MTDLCGGVEQRRAALADLAPIVENGVEQMEGGASLPDDVVDALKRAGAFRMAMPEAWGGPELPMVQILDVIEDLAYLEGAVGWCAMIGCDGGFYTAWLDDEVGRSMYADLDAITAGWVMPAGRATSIDGGYRLTGRWSFGSGSQHAAWFCSGALVEDTMEWRMLFVPADEVMVVPGTWDTTGLRGSGSYDYTVTDVVVPAERTFTFAEAPRRDGPLYAHRGMFSVKVAAVPLGLARRAIDEVRLAAESKIVMPQMVPLRELATTQDALGRAEAIVAANRTWFHDVVARAADSLERGEALSEELRRHLFLSASAAIQGSRQAVELLADVVGSDSVKRGHRFERIRRDLSTSATHIVGRTFEACGRSLLGLDPGHPLF